MPLKTQRDEEPSLNLTSMIDVLFLLIIFFMAATKFTEAEYKIGLTVPAVTDPGAMTSAPAPKVISVYQDGHLTLGSQEVTVDELKQRLAAARSQYKDLGVLIRGDRAATHGRMAEVYTASKQAGIGDLAISVKQDTATR